MNQYFLRSPLCKALGRNSGVMVPQRVQRVHSPSWGTVGREQAQVALLKDRVWSLQAACQSSIKIINSLDVVHSLCIIYINLFNWFSENGGKKGYFLKDRLQRWEGKVGINERPRKAYRRQNLNLASKNG